jgi:hypothetical protein
MEHVVIGVDPHKLSATIEVVDHQEKLLGSGRFTTDKAGYAAMLRYARTWPDSSRSAPRPCECCSWTANSRRFGCCVTVVKR